MTLLRPRGPVETDDDRHRGRRLSANLRLRGIGLDASLTQLGGPEATLALRGLASLRLGLPTPNLDLPGIDLSATIQIVPPAALLRLPGIGLSATLSNLAPPAQLAANLGLPGIALSASLTQGQPSFALDPLYSTNWAKHQNDTRGTVSQLGSAPGSGVRGAGGPAGDEAVGNVAIWSRNKSGPGWTATLDTIKTDAFVPAAGQGDTFTLLYGGVVGDGTPGFPRDLAAWPATTNAYSHTYRAHVRGFRASLYFQNAANTGETGAMRVAVFKADDVAYVLTPDSTVTFPQLRNKRYSWLFGLTVVGANGVLSIQQTDANVAPPVVRSVTFTSPLLKDFAAPSDGAFGLLWAPGRVVEVSNLVITVPAVAHLSATLPLAGIDLDASLSSGDHPTTFPNGYAARRRLVAAAQADLPTDTLTNFPLFVGRSVLAGDWLKPALPVLASADWSAVMNLAGLIPVENPGGGIGSAQDFNQLFFGIYGGVGASFANITGGMTLGGGTQGNADVNCVLMAARCQHRSAPWTATFRTKKTDANAGPSGGQAETGLYLYIGLHGDGTVGHPPDICCWKQGLSPSRTLLKAHGEGVLLPLYYQTPSSHPETFAASAEVLDGSGGSTIISPTSPVTFGGTRNTVYTWTISWDGSSLVVAENDGVTTLTATFTSPLLALHLAAGSLGFLIQPGRTVDLTDFTFTGPLVSLATLVSGFTTWASPTGITFGFPSSGYAWPRNGTYHIDGYSQDADASVTPADAGLKDAVRAAALAWSIETGLTFTDVGDITSPSQAQIKVVYSNIVNGTTSDADTFQPSVPNGGVIFVRGNYATSPAWTGSWAVGTYFFHAVMHEFGHAIGLRHPPYATLMYDYAKTIMYPSAYTHTPYATRPRQADGEAIRRMYALPLLTGGKLLSVSDGVPRDLRPETDTAVKLDHHAIGYEPAAGAASLRQRLPSWAAASAPFPMFLYYGKAGLGSSEENRPGAWAAAFAARRLDTGEDVSGKGRSLSDRKNVAPVLLNGLPAGLFGNSAPPAESYLRRTTPAANDLSGLTGLTTLLFGSISGIPDSNVWRIGGTGSGTSRANLWHNEPQSDGATGALNMGWTSAGGTNAGNEFGRSEQGSLTTGLHVLAGSVLHDAHPMIAVDGVVRAYTKLNAGGELRTGAVQVQGGDFEVVGAGTGSNLTALPGTWHIQELYSGRLSPTWLAIHGRMLLDSGSVVGIGAEDLPGDAVESPVAVPLRLTVPNGVATDVDVAAMCLDSQVPRTIALTSVTSVPNCAAAIAAGRARLTPAAGFTGQVAVPFAVAKSAKSSSSRLFVTVTSGVGPPPGGEPRDWGAAEGITVTKTVKPDGTGDFTTIAAAAAAAQAGWKVLIYPGTYAGFTVGGNGTAANPIVFAAASDARTRPLDVVIGSGGTTINGNFVSVWGIDFGASGDVTILGLHCTLMRFRTRNISVQVGRGLGGNSTANNGQYSRIGYCDLSLTSTGRVGINVSGSAKFTRLVAVYGHDWTANIEVFRFGENPPDDVCWVVGQPGMRCIAERCLMYNIHYPSGGNNEAVSVKTSDCELRQLAVVQPSGIAAGAVANINIRHGNRNILDGCYTEGPQSGINIRGYGNTVLGPRTVGGDGVNILGGNVTTAQWAAIVADQIANGGNPGNGKYVLAENTIIVSPVGNVSPVPGNGSLLDINTVIKNSAQATGYPSRWTINNAPPFPASRPAIKWTVSDINTLGVGIQSKFSDWPA